MFAGGVDVTIQAAGNLEIDAQFIVAQVNGQSCFFLALDAELPLGIPLFLDVALYGLSGMFASNFRPNIGSDTWWDWYKYPAAYQRHPGPHRPRGLYRHRSRQVGQPDPGALALGAGA